MDDNVRRNLYRVLWLLAAWALFMWPMRCPLFSYSEWAITPAATSPWARGGHGFLCFALLLLWALKPTISAVITYGVGRDAYDQWVEKRDAESERLRKAEWKEEQARYEAEHPERGALKKERAAYKLERQRLSEEITTKQERTKLKLDLERLQKNLDTVEESTRAAYGKKRVQATKAPAKPTTPQLPPWPSVTPHLTDGQIEALALKAVTRIGALPSAKQAGAWQEWASEMRSQYGPYAASEVQQRAARMRGMTDH